MVYTAWPTFTFVVVDLDKARRSKRQFSAEPSRTGTRMKDSRDVWNDPSAAQPHYGLCRRRGDAGPGFELVMFITAPPLA